MSESKDRNPLVENSLKSSLHLKLNKVNADKMSSLIKEDSNEENSSNSNEMIDTQIEPIKKD